MTPIRQGLIDISLIRSEEILELVTFHNSFYRNHRKPEHWIWQYKTYQPDKVIFAVARDNGKLIATQAMMPVYMRVNDKPVLTGKSENTLLLKDMDYICHHRNQSILCPLILLMRTTDPHREEFERNRCISIKSRSRILLHSNILGYSSEKVGVLCSIFKTCEYH